MSSSRKIISGLFLLLFLALLFLGGREFWYQQELKKMPVAEIFPTSFEIQKGASPQVIAANLEEEGLLSSSRAFLLYLDRTGLDRDLQAGIFSFPVSLPLPELAMSLTQAENRQIRLTLLEGWTNADIDAALVKKGLSSPGKFLACLSECDFSDFPFLPSESELHDGFFWMDTYFINPTDFSEEDFAKRLLLTFDKKTKSLFWEAPQEGWDILKMASVLEKEGRGIEERKIIAGILWKRLESDWLLGADATTRYAVKNWNDPLTVSQLQEKNGWNTRAEKGLPKGAINNPSWISLQAAAYPKETSFWYYLHDNDGKIHYAETLEQHNANKAKYISS